MVSLMFWAAYLNLKKGQIILVSIVFEVLGGDGSSDEG